MTLSEAVRLSKTEGRWFKRPDWHYSLVWCEELGYLTTHYNCENCSVFDLEDAIATDYISEEIQFPEDVEILLDIPDFPGYTRVS